ncbi:MAG: SLC13 family permease [Acidobacteriota bacterium]
MTLEMMALTLIIVGAIVLFALDIFPVDKVSALLLATLIATRLVSAKAAISGFGNTATITVACMLALSYGLERTGALNYAANKIVELAGASEIKVLLAIIFSVGVLSAFINNTAAVAIFLPLTLSVTRKQGLNASKFLMPMSFAAMFAGTCTLIGTSTNLLVSALVLDRLQWQVQMFEFTPMGLVFFAAGGLYLVFVGRHLLVSRRTEESLTEHYRLRNFVTELILRDQSPLIGRKISETLLREKYNIEVIEILRGETRILPGDEEARIQKGDMLLVQGDPKTFMEITDEAGVTLKALKVDDRFLQGANIVMVEAFISPTSRLVDRTLKEVDFRRQYKANALAIRSHGRTIREKIGKVRLEYGDCLLILAKRQQLDALRQTRDFLVLEEVSDVLLRKDKIPYAVGIFVGIVALASLQILSILEAALIGSGLMLLTGCFRLREIYNNLHWETIVMLGCLIPLGSAMQETGMASLIAHHLITQLRNLGPVAVLSGIYLVTTLLTAVMSNSATAVLMVPIALSVAQELGLSAKPFIFAVMFAASASFMTPVGYQTNTFIFGAGGYKFSDFMKVGAPLNLAFWILGTLLIPVFWPF